MKDLLKSICEEQSAMGDVSDERNVVATLVLSTGEKVVGLIQGVADDDVVTILRLVDDVYADIPRHYALSAVVGAYYTEGS